MSEVQLSRGILSLMIISMIGFNFGHNFEIPDENNAVKPNADINYTNILNFWQNHKHDFNLHIKNEEVVLAMGNTGSGKTTLTAALAGRRLNVTRLPGQSYLTIIDEENKIGTGISSKTLIPEVLIDEKRNVTYIDCSGFRDNRNIEYEISSLYFQNILMSQIKKIKFLFVINYESVKISGNKNDFDDLFEHIGEFIKNVSKFSDGMALVVTKVENIYEISDDDRFFLANNDQLVLNGIAHFLREKQKVFKEKIHVHEKYRMYVNMIDTLLQKKENSFTRIAIFRQPVRRGLLENIPRSKRQIDVIAKLISENLKYIEKSVDDFGFALSASSKEIVDQIVDDIFRKVLMNRLLKMGNETLLYYLQTERRFNDIEILQDQFLSGSKKISNIQNADGPLQLFDRFLNATNALNIPVSLTNLNSISEEISQLHFFTTISNSYKDLHLLLLKIGTQNITDLMENFKNYYVFLNDLQHNLATYRSQTLKDDIRLENIITLYANRKNEVLKNVPNLEAIIHEIGSEKFSRVIETMNLNQVELKHLGNIFKAFTTKLEFICSSSSEHLTVKGYNVRMSDVVKADCWTKAKIIQVFALNKVFIDCTIDKTSEEAQFSILAPTWEIMGGQKIILDGKIGESHKQAEAASSFSSDKNGTDGLPGLPGGPAGHFFGVGKEFINSEYLEIHANGGKGGPGQDGGRGKDGSKGDELPKSFFDDYTYIIYVQSNLNKTHFNYTYAVIESPRSRVVGREISVSEAKYKFYVHGKPATPPTAGGNGGAGGQGGYPGEIVINGLGKSIQVKTYNNQGALGLQGQGGNGGKGAPDGRDVKFCHYKYEVSIFQKDLGPYYNIEWFDGAKNSDGKNGKSGGNQVGQKLPTELTKISPYPLIKSFKDFLRLKLPENIKESKMREFIHKLENDDNIKAIYDTLAFVKELEGLENQLIELGTEIDYTTFYDSFLIRVEEYAKNEQILENKKVLSYIYAAVITKIFTLKKKKKGQTIINLPKYLDTIETDIRELNKSCHLQIIQQYRDDDKYTLNKKIQDATHFIESTIEPELDKLWDRSNHQINAIVDKINQNRNSTKEAIKVLEKNKEEVRRAMLLRGIFFPLKLAATVLSFFGPISAGIGAAVTATSTIAEGLLLDRSSSLGKNKIQSLDPNLKLISRVTEVINNKHQLVVDKLIAAMMELMNYEKQLPLFDSERKRNIEILKTQLHEATFRETNGVLESFQRQKDIKMILKKIDTIINVEKNIVAREIKQAKEINDSRGEEKYEENLRLLNRVQSVLNRAEIVFSFTRKLVNDEGLIGKIDEQISAYDQQLKALEKMETQVYDIIIPDVRNIEETINDIQNSFNGSSHAKLDLTNWNVRTTLRNLKSLLQKFTQKMTFEVRRNLDRYMEKIDEGFSILIDIYDRIDSYTDSVKQAEYIAHIESASMRNVYVSNGELSTAVNNLELIIHSNVLKKKYELALHTFKQHYFPFAAHVLESFQLPSGIQLNDTETLRSNIINKIKDMKNHVNESSAIIGKYSKYTHEKIVFNSDTVGSSPFYTWKYDTISDKVYQLLTGSEIVLKADITKGLPLNSVKFNDIGINFKFENGTLQNSFTSVLKNFALTMTVIGNNYYRCGERYYFISFDEDIRISYTLQHDKEHSWINPNEVCTLLHESHTFLSPYAVWSIKLRSINPFFSFHNFQVYVNESIDLELIGKGYYIEQNNDFVFDICDEYLDEVYEVETISKVLTYHDDESL